MKSASCDTEYSTTTPVAVPVAADGVRGALEQHQTTRQTMKSKHLCPDCKTPLTVENHSGEVHLYCAYGPCGSYVANDGATAATEDEAWKKLEAAVEDDINERMEE